MRVEMEKSLFRLALIRAKASRDWLFPSLQPPAFAERASSFVRVVVRCHSYSTSPREGPDWMRHSPACTIGMMIPQQIKRIKAQKIRESIEDLVGYE